MTQAQTELNERRPNPPDVLADLWALSGLDSAALRHAVVTGQDPVMPSSFAVGTAAQTSIAAAALAACELGNLRGQSRQTVSVDMTHAALECTAWFSLNGKVPPMWDKFSGAYHCADGWVRIHTNFAHHRDGALALMGLDAATASRADAEGFMRTQSAFAFEQAAADAGLVVAAIRTFDEWDASPQGQAIALQPLISFEKIGNGPPRSLPSLQPSDRPLHGLRVLDLTRILAGPVCGRQLAAYGADVMLVNAPHLPNIDSIADTSRGKLSCHIDLRTLVGQTALKQLMQTAHVFVQGYRPGALAAFGFDAVALAQRCPGIVCVSLSAYGDQGPWGTRRGFDSLVQSAMGFNHAEAQAAATDSPKPLPVQILDYATGHLMAYAAAAALQKQQQEGGSWHIRLSLARTGQWLRSLGRIDNGLATKMPDRTPYLETAASGYGELVAVKHSARMSATPPGWARLSMPPGTHAAVWP
jgi:crotonobetainyl-CoA:carnitine CoA-transferase CaiB-like acyl-CoA transferase